VLGRWLSGRSKAELLLNGEARNAARLAKRYGHFALKSLAAIGALLALCGSLFYARLAIGPISLNGFAPQIAKALGERFDHGFEFSLGEVAIVQNGYKPALRTGTLVIKEASGRTVFSAPRAELSLDPLSVLTGRVILQGLELFDVELHLALRADGSVVLPIPASSEGAAPATLPIAAPVTTPGEGPAPDFSSAAPLTQVPPGPAAPFKPRSLLVKRLGAAIRLAVNMLTGSDSPAAAIDHIGIMGGKLVIDDETAGQSIVFNGVNLSFDKQAGAARFELSAEGPNGRWQAAGMASGSPGSQRSLSLLVSNVSLDEILLLAGTRKIGADFDMPLSAKLDLRLNAEDKLSAAAAEFWFGSGYLRFDDPDDEPLMIDKITGALHWDPAARRIVIERGQLLAGSTHFALAGAVKLPAQEGDPWRIQLANSGSAIASPEHPGEQPVTIDQAELSARLYLAEKNLVLDRFSLRGPQCGFALAGTVDWANGPHVRLGASISPSPVGLVLRLWPSFLASHVKAYLLPRARGGVVERGTVQVDFDAADLEAMRADHAPGDGKVLVDFALRNASLDFLPGVPPLRGIDGTGHITGRAASFSVSRAEIEAGGGRSLTLSDGGFRVADTDAKPIRAVLNAKVSGSVEAIGDLLSRESLKPYAGLPLDPATLSGQAEGSFEVAMKVGSGASPSDTELKVNATVANFVAERLIGNEKLDGATLLIDVDPARLRATGEGSMFGAPAEVVIEKWAGKPAEASISVTFSEEARARQGFGAIPGITGPVGAKIFAPVGTGEKPKAKVELDLTPAAIDLAGISKPAGRPAKIAFSLAVNDSVTTLDSIAVEAGAIQARGRAEIGPQFSVVTASFPQARFSAGDEMRIEATSAGGALKIMVRGNVIDVRPFLRSLLFSPAESSGAPQPSGEYAGGAIKDIEVDVNAGILSGHNKQVITGAELHFAKRGTQIKQFSFAGTFGRQPISCNLTSAGNLPQLNLMSEDAGAFLAFLDLYKRMERGRLSVGMVAGEDQLAGVLIINDFILRDEPALRRLVLEGAPPLGTAGRPQKIDADAVAFNKLQVRFRREGGRLMLSEGTMNGEAIGLTVDGTLDFTHDSVDMRGTFVPIYAFNNMFARIPVVGLILGGGSEEQGLIGVNWRITGKASAPVLSINPLSAVAPGIFRQIFGVVDFDPLHPRQ
jgi:hypothetical protein